MRAYSSNAIECIGRRHMAYELLSVYVCVRAYRPACVHRIKWRNQKLRIDSHAIGENYAETIRITCGGTLSLSTTSIQYLIVFLIFFFSFWIQQRQPKFPLAGPIDSQVMWKFGFFNSIWSFSFIQKKKNFLFALDIFFFSVVSFFGRIRGQIIDVIWCGCECVVWAYEYESDMGAHAFQSTMWDSEVGTRRRKRTCTSVFVIQNRRTTTAVHASSLQFTIQ